MLVRNDLSLAVAIVAVAAAVAAVFALLRLRRMACRTRHEVEARSAAARLELYCPLTGLPNRRRALASLSSRLARPQREPPAVIHISFGGESFEPEAQARLAGTVAERLNQLAGEDGLVAHLAPGEFLIVPPDGTCSTRLIALAALAVDTFGDLLGDEFRPRIGAALAEDSDTAVDLVARAAAAAPSDPAGRTSPFGVRGRELEWRLRTREAEASALAEAIADGRIEPFFQPLVELGSGRVLGFEVLARWRESGGNLRLPDTFIRVAEECGLIGTMFFALLRQVAAEVREWPPEWSFALNLSPLQFAETWLVERIVQTLLRAGVAPGRLELEISERAVEHDFEGARRIIGSLRRQGISVTLDDFGSGRLPLRDLARLQFDRLKVHRATLGDTGAGSEAALGLISAAARSLRVPVVVLGIETHAGAREAQTHGCEIGQGFLFGRPDSRTECFRMDGALVGGLRKAG